MHHIELEDGDRVVVDVGHSGGVVGLGLSDDLVVSGADDGFVFVRDHEGHSVVPPAHLPAITTLVLVPASDLAVVGTVGRAEGVDLATGRHAPVAGLDDTVVTAACQWGAEAMVGCADGTVRALTPESGVRRLADLDEPVRALAAAGNGVVATTAAGTVVALDGSGDVVWRTPRAAGEVHAVAVHGDRVVIAGAGPAVGSGRLLLLDDAGGELAVQDLVGAVVAVASGRSGLVAALVDGSIRTVDGLGGPAPEPRLGEAVGTVDDVAIETIAIGPDDEVWFGTAGGRVGRIGADRELPARSSGVVGMSFATDLRTALAVDGRRLLRYDLVGGGVEELGELPGGVAVTHAGPDAAVVGYVDGRLERREGRGLRRIVATGNCGLSPTSLGWHRGVVLAEDDASYSTVDATTLDPAELDEDQFFEVTAARRQGFAFVGHGAVAGVEVSVVEVEDLVVVRPGTVSVSDGARNLCRVWRDGRWVGPA